MLMCTYRIGDSIILAQAGIYVNVYIQEWGLDYIGPGWDICCLMATSNHLNSTRNSHMPHYNA